MRPIAVIMMGLTAWLAAPAAAFTYVTDFDKASLDCFDNGAGSEICAIDYPFFFVNFDPPAGRSRTTISTQGVAFMASGDFISEYHWDFYALDGSLLLGNNSYGAAGSFSSFNGAASGFISDLVVTPTMISYIADVPLMTDRCPNLFAQYGTVGYVCSESLAGVETWSASLAFSEPPDNFSLTVVQEALPGPGVPEPASWALLIAGFGLTGVSLRRRRGLAG